METVLGVVWPSFLRPIVLRTEIDRNPSPAIPTHGVWAEPGSGWTGITLASGGRDQAAGIGGR